MNLRPASFVLIAGAVVAVVLAAGPSGDSAKSLAAITVDYPLEDSLFPPDFAVPTFIWRDASQRSSRWRIEVSFADGQPPIRREISGERLKPGEIDPRCVAPTNKPPKLTPKQAGARIWRPDPGTWASIKHRSVDGPARVTITGYIDRLPVSRGSVTIRTSEDPVGAPIFYRDVPLMPSELKKGVIKPLSPQILPYVAWRLRDVSKPKSRVLLTDMYTCANCHSFSRDGRTLGMDLDGPDNDKGLYAIVPIRSKTVIADKAVISWRKFRGQMEKGKRIGFMSRVSPDSRYVITATQVKYYVANFMDYRFLQVFYPTRGILAWYDRAEKKIQSLPGADDERYVHTNAVWSPDGEYLVFSRARAKDSYPADGVLADYANDPKEVPIQYDLYRIPFNGGRGGQAEPIAGASHNGMSNSFPKISPDGRWIVFVQAKNGQLMRPDSKLYIVPTAGGKARRMRCNTPLMNSWHSFSPNGRWLVFSSKSRSPYTKMFLTHIDQEGNDTPAILIENSTAANRAVNIPEFVNVSPDNFQSIEVPAADFYRIYDRAYRLAKKGRLAEAIAEWKKALALDPEDASAHNNLGALLLRQGDRAGAAAHLERALAVRADLPDAHSNLGLLLMAEGKLGAAVTHLRQSLELKPNSVETRVNLGGALLMRGEYAEAVEQLREALRLDPERAPVLDNLAWILATCPEPRVRDGADAVKLAERAVAVSPAGDIVALDTLGAAYAEAGRFPEALKTARHAAALATQSNDDARATDIKSRIALYESGRPYHEAK